MKIHFFKCLSLCLSFFKLRQNTKTGSQVNGKIRLCVPFLAIMEFMALIIMDFLDKKEVLAECIERKLSTLTM